MNPKPLSYVDFEILNNPTLLMGGNIAIYGAGERGTRISGLLNNTKLNVVSLTDIDPNKWGRRINHTVVLAPADMRDALLAANGKRYVISCIENTDECYEFLSALFYGEDIGFISYWGIDMCLYMHRERLFHNALAASLQFERDAALDFIIYTRGEVLNRVESVLKRTNEIWIYQPGKVGSTSLSRMLNASGTPYLKIHSLLSSEYRFLGELYPIWNQTAGTLQNGRIKLISLVRNPLARDYSAFWEVFVCGTQRRRYIPFLSANLQEMYDSFVDIIVNQDKKYEDAHIAVWREEFNWFDEEFKECFDLDIYQQPFDQEKGYTIIHNEYVDLFLMKLEKLDSVLPALNSFIGGNIHRTPQKAYSASSKIYSMAYRAFHQKVKLKKTYVDHYFSGNKKVDHFYTKEEQEKFLDEWKDNIELV